MAAASAYIGLISGTSADGIDAALVRFDPEIELLAARTVPYAKDVRTRLLALTHSNASVALDEFGALDVEVGECFAAAALSLIEYAGVAADAIAAIGSHGQTVRHRPTGAHPFTLQIGDPSIIAERTGLCTISDFRRADVAAGGQGAPLMSAFHAAMLAGNDAIRVILNLGGIANVTVLDPARAVFGFDTGPANCLLDGWAGRHLGTVCDHDGAWAREGQINHDLLARWLEDPYFATPAPKSTGREMFNLDWLDQRLPEATSAVDVQATLLALTSRSVAEAVRSAAPQASVVFVCGGGVHNAALMQALARDLAPIAVSTTASVGIDPDHVEAMGFAWLARERLAHRPANVPSVTGARGARVLGAIYSAP
ncbi:MAG: anhydro-N-acetylmuramic acid kinase [Rhodanobacteraceae bacterium]